MKSLIKKLNFLRKKNYNTELQDFISVYIQEKNYLEFLLKENITLVLKQKFPSKTQTEKIPFKF